MRKRPYAHWERLASEVLRTYGGPEFQVRLVKPVARALHKAFVRGYQRAAYRRRPRVTAVASAP